MHRRRPRVWATPQHIIRLDLPVPVPALLVLPRGSVTSGVVLHCLRTEGVIDEEELRSSGGRGVAGDTPAVGPGTPGVGAGAEVEVVHAEGGELVPVVIYAG